MQVSGLQEAVIVGAARTPIGVFGGALAPVSASQLGATAIKGALANAGKNGCRLKAAWQRGRSVSAGSIRLISALTARCEFTFARHLGTVTHTGLKPEQVEEVIMGNVVSAGLGQAPARQASMFAGIPVTTPAITINKVRRTVPVETDARATGTVFMHPYYTDDTPNVA